MAGETLPPVVAVLQGDITDLVAKVALAAQEVESLDGVTGTATADLNFAPLDAGLATVTGQLDLFEHTFGQMQLELGLDFAKFEAELAAVEAMAKAAPIEMSASINMAPAVAKFAAGSAAMQAIASKDGGGAGNGGLLALLGWGGGMFGAAAFGSVLSLAGAGFEHLATMALGLAGSLAGALAGGALLAAGSLGKMAVGMGSDMLVMRSTIADTQTLSSALTAIQTAQLTYGKNSAQAAAATQALNVQMALLGNTSGVQAELGLAKAAQALNSFWDQATSNARVAAVGFMEPFFQIAYTYIPLIAQSATFNFGLMTQAFQGLIAWIDGPGTGAFKDLENMFAAELPTAIDALTQGFELFVKIIDDAAQRTGGFMNTLDYWLTKWNSELVMTQTATGTTFSGPVDTMITKLVGMFRDWWDLIKQIGITIYDVFHLSAGLGTSLVVILTNLLKQVDSYLTSVTGKASVKTLFTVHLQEVEALIAALAPLAGAFAQVYIAVATGLTVIATDLADAIGWMIKLPAVGPWIAFAGAIGILVWRMNALKLVMATIAGFKNVLTLIQALSMGAGFKDAISIAFGNTSSIAANTGAVDANTAALGRLTAVMAGESIPGVGGAGGGAGGAGAGLPGILSEVGQFASVLSTTIAPFAALAASIIGLVAIVNMLPHSNPTSPVAPGPGTGGAPPGVAGIQAAYKATWQALLDSSNAMYKNSSLFQQNLQTDLAAAGVPMAQVPGDAKLIAAEFANGQIKSSAQLAAIIQGLSATAGDTAAQAAAAAATAKQNAEIAATTSAANKIIGNAFGNIQVNILGWESALLKAGVSESVAASATAALTAFIKIHGPITANEMAAFQFAATATHASAASMALDAAALSKFVSIHGPLTAQELLLYENAITASKGNGLIVQQDMAILSKFVSLHGPLTATEFGVFQTLIGTSGISAGTINSVMATVAAFVKVHGPLTTTQMLEIQNDLAHGQTSSWQIELSLATISQQMSYATQSASGIASMLAKLHASIPGTVNLTGGGKGFFAEGGVSEAPMSGGLAVLHGTEAIVPKSKAGDGLWGLMMGAIAGSGPVNMSPNMGAVGGGPAPGTVMGITPLSGGGGGSLPGGSGFSANYNITINMGAGTTSPQIMKAVIVQALEQHDNDLMRQMGGRPRIGAMQ